MVLENNMVKVISWYDNESAYSARCIDLPFTCTKKAYKSRRTQCRILTPIANQVKYSHKQQYSL